MGPALRGTAVIQDGRRHPPLQSKTGTARSGTSRTPSPTHSVPRWERRDTWVPPYGVRRSSRADRVVRPYKAEQEPRKTGRRGRRALRNHKGCVQWAGRGVRPYKAEQEPRKTGRRGRRPLHTLFRAGNGGTHGSRPTGCGGHTGRTGSSAPTTGRRGRRPLRWGTRTAQNGTSRTACPTNRRGAARTAKFRIFFFPLSASAGLRRLYSDDTGRPPVL